MRCLTALLKQYKYLCLSSVRSETSRVGASPRDEVGASRNRRRILDSSESARRFTKTYPGASERNLIKVFILLDSFNLFNISKILIQIKSNIYFLSTCSTGHMGVFIGNYIF